MVNVFTAAIAVRLLRVLIVPMDISCPMWPATSRASALPVPTWPIASPAARLTLRIASSAIMATTCLPAATACPAVRAVSGALLGITASTPKTDTFWSQGQRISPREWWLSVRLLARHAISLLISVFLVRKATPSRGRHASARGLLTTL